MVVDLSLHGGQHWHLHLCVFHLLLPVQVIHDGHLAGRHILWLHFHCVVLISVDVGRHWLVGHVSVPETDLCCHQKGLKAIAKQRKVYFLLIYDIICLI